MFNLQTLGLVACILSFCLWTGVQPAFAGYLSPELSEVIVRSIINHKSQFNQAHAKLSLKAQIEIVEEVRKAHPSESIGPISNEDFVEVLSACIFNRNITPKAIADRVEIKTLYLEVCGLVQGTLSKLAQEAQGSLPDFPVGLGPRPKIEKKRFYDPGVALVPGQRIFQLATSSSDSSEIGQTKFKELATLGIPQMALLIFPTDKPYFLKSKGKTIFSNSDTSLYLRDPSGILTEQYVLEKSKPVFSVVLAQRTGLYQSLSIHPSVAKQKSQQHGSYNLPLHVLQHWILNVEELKSLLQRLAGRNLKIFHQGWFPEIPPYFENASRQRSIFPEMVLIHGNPPEAVKSSDSTYYVFTHRGTFEHRGKESLKIADSMFDAISEDGALRIYEHILEAWRSKKEYPSSWASVYFPTGVPRGLLKLTQDLSYRVYLNVERPAPAPVYPLVQPPENPPQQVRRAVPAAAGVQNDILMQDALDASLLPELGLNLAGAVKVPLRRLYQKIHYYVFDFNLDAIPAFIRTHKRFIKYHAENLADLKVQITVIRPNYKENRRSIVPSTLDEEINLEVLRLAQNSKIELDYLNQRDLIHPKEKPSGELVFYIGETVDCGSTSSLSRTKKYVTGTVNDPLTQYHLQNLQWVKYFLKPDVLLSENHTFPLDVRKSIDDVLNGAKTSAEAGYYHIKFHKISHAHYSRENRTRIYMIASQKFLPEGYPDLSKYQTSLPGGTFTSAKSANTQNFFPEVQKLPDAYQNLIKTYEADQLSKPQKLLLESILKNYYAAMTAPFDGAKLESYKGRLVLAYQGKKYWLVLDQNEEYSLARPGVVFFNETSGEIRIVKKQFLIDRVEPWIQARFWNSCQNRTCNTITSAEAQGILTWGTQDRKLSPYEVARVHGGSKQYSEIVGKSLASRNNSGYYNVPNAYISHMYSTSVVSRLIMSVLFQYQLNETAYTQKWPSQFDKLQIEPTAPSLETQLMERAFSGGKLVFHPAEDYFSLVDGEGKSLTPGMVWKQLQEGDAHSLLEVDDKKDLEEPNLGLPPQSPLLADVNHQLGLDSELSTPHWGLQATLFQHQKDGIEWLLSRRNRTHGGILADDMGLGKTLQTIGYITAVKKAALAAGQRMSPPFMLVVKPKLLFNWVQELKRFAPEGMLRLKTFTSCSNLDSRTLLENQTQQATRVDVFLVTQSVIQKCADSFVGLSFDSIFVDEAQYMRNDESQFAQELSKLVSEYRFCLSGTPVENSPRDIWSLMNFIEPGFLGSVKEFEKAYKIKGAKDISSLLVPLRVKLAPYLLRRTKDQIAKTDPAFQAIPKTVIPVEFKLRPLQKLIYSLMHKMTLEKIMDGDKKFTSVFAELTHLVKVCDHPHILNTQTKEWLLAKLSALYGVEINDDVLKQEINYRELIRNDDHIPEDSISPKLWWTLKMLHNRFKRPDSSAPLPRPVVIFSRFNGVLSRLESDLNRLGIDSEIVNGEKDSDLLPGIFERFDQNKIPVLLVNLQAGVGLNLQAADTEIFMEPWWNPQLERQAEDRVHRIGQKHPVTIYKLLTLGTLEVSQVLQNQSQKSEMFRVLLDPGGQISPQIQNDLDDRWDRNAFEALIQELKGFFAH